MTTPFNARLHQGTPTITVIDNRGLTVRELNYNRTNNPEEKLDERITVHKYNKNGHLISSIDPRLYSLQLQDDTVKPNVTYRYNLLGTPIYSHSIDTGWQMILNDIAGRPIWQTDARGTKRRWEYEEGENSLGRPIAVYEKAANREEKQIEFFVYAQKTVENQQHNLCKQCTHHYDTAGLRTLNSLSLTGKPLQQQQQLLRDIKQPVNWAIADKRALLENQVYTTQQRYDANDNLLTQTDAKGHRQRLEYNVTGQLKASWLKLHEKNEQQIVKSLEYSAAGQKLREESGNGVVTEYRYQQENQRLIQVKMVRASTILQNLHYQYDPVGNIVSIRNDAVATRFYRNQIVVPESTYRYDALYQLISATGREAANAYQQTTTLPLLNGDNSQYDNYQRSYHYDRGGNLTRIQHHGRLSYTTEIQVAKQTNRALQVFDGLTPDNVNDHFDAAGNQKFLQPGQSLVWNRRNQLQQFTSVIRKEDQGNDEENYLYDSGAHRWVKQCQQKTAKGTNIERVIYLPGIELRTKVYREREQESLQVISLAEAGRAQVRVLHWEKGKPADIDNDQLRYSYHNHIGSSQLELDQQGNIISQEEYYPYGGTALWAGRNQTEAKYKTVKYSGKERDTTGLYYYGYRYYQPWIGRWLNTDPAGTVDGLNLYRMVRNNPVTLQDPNGLAPNDNENNSTRQAQYNELATEAVDRLNPHRNDGQLRRDSLLFLQSITGQHQDNRGTYLLEQLGGQNNSARDFVAEGHRISGRGDLQQLATKKQVVDHLSSALDVFNHINGHFAKIKSDLTFKVNFNQLEKAWHALQQRTMPLFKLKEKVVPKANVLSASLTLKASGSRASTVNEYFAVSGEFSGQYFCPMGNIIYLHAAKEDGFANIYSLNAGHPRRWDTEFRALGAVSSYWQTVESQPGYQRHHYQVVEINMTSTLAACHSCLSAAAIFAKKNGFNVNIASCSHMRSKK